MNRVILTLLTACASLAVVTSTNDTGTLVDDDMSLEEQREIEASNWDPSLVTVAEGQLRGVAEEAVDGKQFYSFRGIPYAKPPVGKLRFQPPEDAEPWSDERSASEDPPRCPQMPLETLLFAKPFQLVGQEDCLYLNVFSPMHRRTDRDLLLPVMVFIHGGAYFHGYAGQYPPHSLLTKDIILVVIQYRLGTLGFLSTEDDTAPGNMGILDQTLALKWIQTNAASFGGNPLRITIVGQDAGGSSAHLQVLSHTSLGYFHRAILMSGNALAPWAMGTNHRESAYLIAKMLDCQSLAGETEAAKCTEDSENSEAYDICLVDQLPSEKILQCLRDAPVEALTESVMWFIVFGFYPVTMGPRVHKNLLMKDPVKLVKENRAKKIEILYGSTRDDGALITLGIFSNEGLRSALRFRFEELGPMALDFKATDISPLNQTIGIFDHYAGGNDFELKNVDGLTDMFTDRMIWYPTDVAAHYQSQDPVAIKKKKNVFGYQFAYRGKQSFGDKYPADIGENWVSHGDDLIYLFGGLQNDGSFGGPLEDEADQKMRDLMVDMWTKFADSGAPTSTEDTFEWTAYTTDKPDVLVIKSQPQMMEVKEKQRNFWRRLPLKINFLLFPDSISNLTKVEVMPPKKTEELPTKVEKPLTGEEVPKNIKDPFEIVQDAYGTQPAPNSESDSEVKNKIKSSKPAETESLQNKDEL